MLLLPAVSSSAVFAQQQQMSLKDVLQVTAKGNRQLQIRSLELKRSEEMVKEAKSFLLPSVQLNSSYLFFAERPVIYLRDESAMPKAIDTKYGGRLAFDANVTAVYGLTNPVVKNQVKAAALQQKTALQNKKALEEQLVVEVSQLYYTVLFYEQQKQVLLQSQLRNEQALTDAKNLYLQGKNLKTDTLSHFIAVQNIKLAVSAVENQIGVAHMQMKQVMGAELSEEILLTDSLAIETAFIHQLLSSAAMEIAGNNRSDLHLAKLRLEQSKLQEERVRAMFKPTLQVFAQYQVQSQADDYRFKYYGLPRTSFAGVRLTVPIYSGNRLKYQSAASAISLKQQELALADITSKAETVIAALSVKLKNEVQQWSIQKQNIHAALSGYQMQYERYKAGLGSRLELTDAELKLTQARLEDTRLQYSIRLLVMDYQKALGILTLTNK